MYNKILNKAGRESFDGTLNDLELSCFSLKNSHTHDCLLSCLLHKRIRKAAWRSLYTVLLCISTAPDTKLTSNHLTCSTHRTAVYCKIRDPDKTPQWVIQSRNIPSQWGRSGSHNNHFTTTTPCLHISTARFSSKHIPWSNWLNILAPPDLHGAPTHQPLVQNTQHLYIYVCLTLGISLYYV